MNPAGCREVLVGRFPLGQKTVYATGDRKWPKASANSIRFTLTAIRDLVRAHVNQTAGDYCRYDTS